jgi:hypothetical protein
MDASGEGRTEVKAEWTADEEASVDATKSESIGNSIVGTNMRGWIDK